MKEIILIVTIVIAIIPSAVYLRKTIKRNNKAEFRGFQYEI